MNLLWFPILLSFIAKTIILRYGGLSLYSRTIPLFLGFILGHLAETYFYISTTRYGMEWLYRPKVIVIFFLAIAVALYPTYQARRLARK
jgi:hypothetical protein